MDSIDWGKTIKKVSITAAQAITSLVFGLSFTGKIVGLLALAHINLTPDIVMGAISGGIAGLLELLRSFLKQKFGLSWL